MQYEIKGTPFPVVECQLAQGEGMITEKGSMVWMSPNMEMETVGGGIGKMFGKAFSGEAMFQNVYRPVNGNGLIAFGSSFPGQILKFDITPGYEIIAQKSAFLCSEMGVQLSVHFQKRVSAGFFGGEGFIMQRLSGNGAAFIEIDGSVQEYNLGPGQCIIVDTGNLAAMEASCQMEIRTVPGLKNKLLGGEGFFNTAVYGPGRVWLQTMPMTNLAAAMAGFGSN